MKVLYVSPVGNNGTKYFKKIHEVFEKTKGNITLDYLIYWYDGFPIDNLGSVAIVKEKRLKWDYAIRYLKPENLDEYDYLMFWDDDLDIDKNFNLEDFFNIMSRNKVDIAQPALTQNSHYSHTITLQDKTKTYGRFTNFVEIMCPVYSTIIWKAHYRLLDPLNLMGWGYDFIPYGIKAIIDSNAVRHTRKVSSSKTSAPKDMAIWMTKYNITKPEQVNLGDLI